MSPCLTYRVHQLSFVVNNIIRCHKSCKHIIYHVTFGSCIHWCHIQTMILIVLSCSMPLWTSASHQNENPNKYPVLVTVYPLNIIHKHYVTSQSRICIIHHQTNSWAILGPTSGQDGTVKQLSRGQYCYLKARLGPNILKFFQWSWITIKLLFCLSVHHNCAI